MARVPDTRICTVRLASCLFGTTASDPRPSVAADVARAAPMLDDSSSASSNSFTAPTLLPQQRPGKGIITVRERSGHSSTVLRQQTTVYIIYY